MKSKPPKKRLLKNFHIRLDEPDKVFQPHEEITGEVVVEVDRYTPIIGW